MPLYDIWQRYGGPTKTPEQRWRKRAQVELPVPYWGPEAQKFRDHWWDLYDNTSPFRQAWALVAEALPDERLFNLEPSAQGVTVFYGLLRENRPRARYKDIIIAPPYNVLYDLRQSTDPAFEEYRENPHGDRLRPLVLGLPGMVEARGEVVQAWPWDRVPMTVDVKDTQQHPELSVAIDQALERGLAGPHTSGIAYDLTGEVGVDVQEVSFYRDGYGQVTGEESRLFREASVAQLLIIPAGYDSKGQLQVAFVVDYRLGGMLGNELHHLVRTEPLRRLLDGVKVELYESLPGMLGNIRFTIWNQPGLRERLMVWVDDQLERGNWKPGDGLSGLAEEPKQTFTTMPDGGFRVQGLFYNPTPQPRWLTVKREADGTYSMQYEGQSLTMPFSWYRAQQLMNPMAGAMYGTSFLLSPEDAFALSVWVDEHAESGAFSGTLVRKKDPRHAVVRETKQALRDGAMPNENVIGFKMPGGYQILTRSGGAETYYLYAFDTEANANAYYDAVVAGTKKLFQFPARSYGRQNPITDVWAKWNKPPKGCISVLFIGVYEDNGERIMFVDMMSTKPEWQRYGVNTAMMLYLQMRWPGHRLLFSDTTHAGHAYAEWWRAQGREVEEQNADFWKRYKSARLLT